MDVETATIGTIEQQLVADEAAIARIRSRQMVLLREVDRRQVPVASGCASLGEWVRGRLDVAPETARDLVTTATRLTELPHVEDAVVAGQVGFDRAVAVARFAGRDDTSNILEEVAGFDIVGIRRRAAKRRRMTRIDDEVAFNDRYLVVEPNLDESAWRLNGRLPGFAGRIVTDALDTKADSFPAVPDGESRAARWADALWAISLDSLCGGDGVSIDDPAPVLTVFVDANEAAGSNGEAGVVVEAGPRVGVAAIEAILCDGVIEVNNTSNQMLGFDRFESVVQAGPNNSAAAMLDHLKREISSFVGAAEPHDDLTLVIIRCKK